MAMMFTFLFMLIGLVAHGQAAVELLQEHDLEVFTLSGGPWYCQGSCTLTSSTDSYRGQHSVKVANRHHNWEGLVQNVQVVGGHTYKLSAYVKLLNLPSGAMYDTAQFEMACKDSGNHDKYIQFGSVTHIQEGVWAQIGGIHKVNNGYHNCHVYVQISSAQVNYLADQFSLKEVPVDGNWKNHANQRIEQIRKADVTVTVTGQHVDTTTLQVELQQTKHEFAFGSVVNAHRIGTSSDPHYNNVFYQNFEWAVLGNALKWPQMEGSQGNVQSDNAMNVVNALRNHGVKVRGHNIFWSVDKFVQNWVKALNQPDLQQAMTKRINDVVGHTKGKVEHWDVNNEDLHGDFYERHTGNPNITMEMFKQVHALDSQVKLFLNDYAILGNSDKAMALKDQTVLLKAAGVPIYGVGIQSHLSANFDMTAVKARLDLVAEAGLPIWITELTVNEADRNKRAQALTDLLTLYFSHPSVEGVLLWGFWDGVIWLQNSALFEGPNFTPNAAGVAYQTLFNKTWRTHVTQTVHGGQPFHMRGFKGQYTVNVRHNGQLLKTETFTLDKNGQSLEIHLSGSSQTPVVNQIAIG